MRDEPENDLLGLLTVVHDVRREAVDVELLGRGQDLLLVGQGGVFCVVGGGMSAVPILAEISAVATTTWVTRRPPQWRSTPFTEAEGRRVVALVQERVRRGLPPLSVASVAGLDLRAQEQDALRRGVYAREPMFEAITPSGVRWDDERSQRPTPSCGPPAFATTIGHLAPLDLRSSLGGIEVDGTAAVRDPRIQLVGYGPSASTIGGNRAGREAARSVTRQLPLAA